MGISNRRRRWERGIVPEYLPPLQSTGPVHFDPTLRTAGQILAFRRALQGLMARHPSRPQQRENVADRRAA
jgi:hypothetical protein